MARARVLRPRRLPGLLVALSIPVSMALGAAQALGCYVEGRALSLVEDIESAHAIYAVRTIDALIPGAARYEVLDVLRGGGDTHAGTHITVPVVPEGLAAHSSRLLLLRHAAGYWDLRPGEQLESFVAAVLALPVIGAADRDGWQARLEFFLPYVRHFDPLLAEGAMQEFAKAPFTALQRLAPRLDAERLVTSLQQTRSNAQRLQTHLSLLAVSGGAQHAHAVEALIASRRDQRRTDSLGTLLATYLELRGTPAIEYVAQNYLRDATRYFEEVEAALPAIRFHWREPTSRISRQQALELFRSVLDRPPVASLVLPDLVAAGDWESLERVVEIYRDHAQEAAWLRPAVLDYLRACPLPQARLALESIERESNWGFRRYGRTSEPSS